MPLPFTASQASSQNNVGLQWLAALPAVTQPIASIQEVPLPTDLHDPTLWRRPERTIGATVKGWFAAEYFHCGGSHLMCSGISAPIVSTVTGAWLAANAAHAGGWAALTSAAIVPPLATGLGLWAGITCGVGSVVGCYTIVFMDRADD